MEVTKKDRYKKRLRALTKDRSSWLTHWKDLADHIYPRRLRFDVDNPNQGTKRNDKIINNTATRALRILASGMMAGITSPARKWFNLVTPDPAMMDNSEVKDWLADCERRIMEVFAKSNFYNALNNVYTDLGGFGTSAMFLEEDDVDIIRAYNYPLGSYNLAQSGRLVVDTIYHETTYNVFQVMQRWGKARKGYGPTEKVRRWYNDGLYDKAVGIVHVIEPNHERDDNRGDYMGMPYSSLWYEKASSGQEILGEGGFNEFPVMAPRWAVTGEDTYGYSPGMDALGDVKALQHQERRSAQVIDKIVSPPMVGPTSLRGQYSSLLPSDVTYVSSQNANAKFEPAITIDPRALDASGSVIARHEERIRQTFFADLFLLLATSHRPQKTAREVDELHEEKMLQLGPVLERVEDELLDPSIDRTFAVMSRRGMLRPAPKVLRGIKLKVEYISVLAQAQKLLGTVGVERQTSFILGMADARPDALDKLNVDKTIDEYSELLGTKPDLIHSADEVEEIRAQHAKEAEEAKMMEQAAAAQQAAGAAKDLSDTNLGDQNALETMMAGTTGV